MKKLNPLGQRLLECKKEYYASTAEVVKSALKIYVQDLTVTTAMDSSILTIFEDESIKIDAFEKHLLEKDVYCIATEDILEKFKENPGAYQAYFDGDDLITTTINKEDVTFAIPIEIDQDFVQNYFGVNEKEAFNLMKRQGFIETFTALRINKLAQQIIASANNSKPIHLTLEASYAYYNPERNTFAIDILISIDANDLSEKENDNISFIQSIKESTEWVINAHLK